MPGQLPATSAEVRPGDPRVRLFRSVELPLARGRSLTVVLLPCRRSAPRSRSSGPGRPGMLLAHLLAGEGVESVVVETRSEEYVASRIRAGILEQSTVDLLREVGLADRLEREGDEHRGIHLQWPGERHHVDFVDLTGRSVWVYGQTEVQKDLVAAARERGQVVHYEVADTALHDLETDEPSITFTRDGRAGAAARRRRGRLRRLVRAVARRRTGPADLGAHLSLLLARHPRRRRPVDRRADLRLAPGGLRAALDAVVDGVAVLPPGAQRHLARRLVRRPDLGRAGHEVHGLDGWSLQTGPITDRSVLPMRSFVADPDAARPAVPGRRRRPHRPADRRQGAQPRRRRRRPPRPRAGRAGCARTTPRSPTRTPTPRSAGSGAAPTSPGG